jgi:hypothetical protein
MPTETMIVIAGIVVAFGAFAIALAFADFRTRNFRTDGATYFDNRK